MLSAKVRKYLTLYNVGLRNECHVILDIFIQTYDLDMWVLHLGFAFVTHLYVYQQL